MVYLLIFTLFLPLMAYSSPAEEISEHRIQLLDTVQDILGGQANFIANDFDSFFATERADDELGRSTIRVRKNFTLEERQKFKNETQFRYNLRLPSLEKRFKDMISDRKAKAGETKDEKKAREQRYVSATQLDTKWLFRSDVSGSVSIHPNITLRSRLRKSWKTGTIIHRFVQEGTWQSYLEGFRQKTTLQSDQTINSNWLFRFGNLVDWKISHKSFTTNHGPALYQRLNDDEAMFYNYGLSTVINGSSYYLSGHGATVGYRKNLYHQFIFMDLGTGLNFPKIYSFRRNPFVYMQIEALFGG
jgi:hypothetical protein